MLTESQLRKAIRGILIREMKTTDYWAGEPIARRKAADAGEMPPAPPSHTPVTTAVRLYTAAGQANNPMGEDISLAIKAAGLRDPASLLALARVAAGMDPVSKFASAEIAALESEISKNSSEAE